MADPSLRVHKATVVTVLLSTALGGVPVLAHEGTLTTDAYKACAEQSLGAACEWSDAHHAQYRGTCRLVTSSLLCVRNQPIVYAPEHRDDPKHDASVSEP